MAGKTKTTWPTGSTWHSGKTKTIRIPMAIADEVFAYARALDQQDLLAMHQKVILDAISRYIEYKRPNRHPNQHSKSLNLKTRSWDELRKFAALVENQPQLLL